MNARAATVDEYLAAAPAEWVPVLTRLRSLCRTTLRRCEETLAYGMPSYQAGGRSVISFARQSRYLSLYVSQPGVLDGFRARLDGVSLGKGCVRFATPGDVRWDVVGDLLVAAEASDEEPC